jgi:PTH1 family peptidyl-tRNA hydrolase
MEARLRYEACSAMQHNQTLLIVGLGNIGPQYEYTRHNAGYLFIESLARACNVEISNSKFHAHLGIKNIEEHKLILAKPQTFMNNSGIAVSAIANFYKIPKHNILVIFDDLDMEFGKIRFRKGGSDAGHNGIKSIDALIGQEYWKMKIGISRPEHKGQVQNYVLSNFTPDELQKLDKIFAQLCAYSTLFLEQNYNTLLNKLKHASQKNERNKSD